MSDFATSGGEGPPDVAQSALNLRLLLLLDSRSPAGGHGHSAGAEAAVEAGFVRDLDDLRAFSRARLRTAGLVSAAFAALASRAHVDRLPPGDWQLLDAELDARTVSGAAIAASRALGRGLRRLLACSAPGESAVLDGQWSSCPRPAPHHPLVLGAGCAIAGGSPLDAARAAANGCVSVPGSASLRLLGLDPYQVHALHHELVDDIERVAEQGAGAAQRCRTAADAAGLPSESAPAMGILAEFHLQQEMRLFAS